MAASTQISLLRRAVIICSSLKLLLRIRSVLLSDLARECSRTQTLPRKRESRWINNRGQEPWVWQLMTKATIFVNGVPIAESPPAYFELNW